MNMASPQSLYFEGVAIVAARKLGKTAPRLIRQDVRKLAVLPIRELAFAGGEEAPVHDQYCSIASEWLAVRGRTPQGPIDWDAFASSPALDETSAPSLDVARAAAARALGLFPDNESLAFLLGGVQAALSILHPEIGEDLLMEDLEGLHDEMDRLQALYDQSGVPKSDRNEFIANSYATLRPNNGGMGFVNLFKLRWTTGGPSRLDVATIPTPARVYVDRTDQEDSPAHIWVVPGSRLVEAKATGKQARKNVPVQPNRIVSVNLTLA
jgi:hypothetical protein